MKDKMMSYKSIFLDYTKNYEDTHRVKLKINHTLRVADNCLDIARHLELCDKDILILYVIGICHDIGRFEQLRIYDSFDDNYCGIDHAKLSNDVLFNDKFIEKFSLPSNEHDIIKKAIYYHNKKELHDNLNERETLFCNIIRDADKLDILYSLISSPLESIFWYNDFTVSNINNNVLGSFYNRELVEYKYVKNNADQIVVFYSYIYDFNFIKSYMKIKENDYYNIFFKRVCENFKSKNIILEMDKINNYVQSFIDEKLCEQ